MSANSWLVKQKKGELVDLASHAGLKNYENFKKSELELALDEHIAANSSQFSADPKFASYFTSRSRSIGSPVKKSSADAGDKLKVTKRRATKVAEDVAAEVEEAAEGASNALVRTPGRALSLASRIPLPATPADVAQVVDRSTLAVRTRVASIYKDSGITEATHATRESLSTVTSVIFVVAAFELWFLRPEILSDRYAFTIPAISFLGTQDYAVFIPDLFLLLTASFWSPALLWAFTSVIAPSIAGYFFNLTVGAHHGRSVRKHVPDYVVDPLTFSIVKAVLSYVVYGQGVTFGGWVDETSIARINSAVYGGWKGVLAGTAITALTTVYDAVLKK